MADKSVAVVETVSRSYSRNTREKADYSTFYVSAIMFKGFPAIKSLGSF
jgi:hypothetical protein